MVFRCPDADLLPLHLPLRSEAEVFTAPPSFWIHTLPNMHRCWNSVIAALEMKASRYSSLLPCSYFYVKNWALENSCNAQNADELLLCLPFLLEPSQRGSFTQCRIISPLLSETRTMSRKSDASMLYQVALSVASEEGRAGEVRKGEESRDTHRSREQEKDVSCSRWVRWKEKM